MKRILFTFILFFILIFATVTTVFAVTESGVIIRVENTAGTDLGTTIHVDTSKVFTGKMVQAGTLSTGYSNLGTDVEILSVPTGGTVTVVATNEHGTNYTIITNGGVGSIGKWGYSDSVGYALPAGLLPVAHTTTPVNVTFSESGTYQISVTLKNLSTSTVLQTKTFNIIVASSATTNNTTAPNEIPAAGIPVTDYTVFGIIILVIFVVGYMLVRKRK